MLTVVLVCFVLDVGVGRDGNMHHHCFFVGHRKSSLPEICDKLVLPSAGDSAGDRASVVLACCGLRILRILSDLPTSDRVRSAPIK